MKALKDRILKDGKCYPGGILKVDKFINHQMDPNLMKDIAVEFIRRFAETEKLAGEQGINMKEADAETLDRLWKAAKETVHSR